MKRKCSNCKKIVRERDIYCNNCEFLTRVDPKILNLSKAISRLPGIKVTCTSAVPLPLYRYYPFYIWFSSKDLQSRGLITLARLLNPSYFPFYKWFTIELDQDDIDPTGFLLRTSKKFKPELAFQKSEELASVIFDHLDNKFPYYNILKGHAWWRPKE